MQKKKWKKEIIFSVILDGSCDSNLKIHFLFKGRRQKCFSIKISADEEF